MFFFQLLLPEETEEFWESLNTTTFFRISGSIGQQALPLFLPFRVLLLLDIYKCPYSHSVECILPFDASDIKE
jgi:hypothetical protein